jgi:hypothetical protein
LKNMCHLSKWKCHNWLRIWWAFVLKLTRYYVLESRHWELCSTMGKEKGAGQCFYWPCLGRQENCYNISWRILVFSKGFLKNYTFRWWTIQVSIILLLPQDNF